MTKKKRSNKIEVLALLANVVNGVSCGSQSYYTEQPVLIQYVALFANNQLLDLVAKSSLVVIPDLPQIGHKYKNETKSW